VDEKEEVISNLFHTKIDVPDFKGGRPLTKKAAKQT
jgi:hypothetical protein